MPNPPRAGGTRSLRWLRGVAIAAACVASQAGSIPIQPEEADPAPLSFQVGPELAGGYPGAVGPHLSEAQRHLGAGNLLLATHALERANRAANGDPRIEIALAELLNRLGRYPEAAALASRTLESSPERAEPHAILATAHLRQGRTTQAIEEYQKFVAKDPANAAVHLQLGNAYLRHGEPEQALAQFEDAAKRDPRLLNAVVNAAILLAQAGRHGDAIARAEQALAADPKRAAAHVVLGDAYQALGDRWRAEREYRRAVELQPAHPPFSDRLAEYYRESNRTESAIEVLEALLTRAPEHRGARETLVELYQAIHQPALAAYHRAFLAAADGRVDEAIRGYREAIEEDPGMTRATLELAALEVRRGDAKAASGLTEQVLEVDPENAAAHTLLGRIWVIEGDRGRAEAELRKAIQADGGYLPAYVELTRLLRGRGRCVEAVEFYQRAARLAPRLAAPHKGLGDCYAALGRTSEAEQAYQQALARAPRHAGALHGLARLYTEAGTNLDTARFLAGQAARIRPDDPRIADTLGWACYRAGEYALAAQHLETAARLAPDDPTILYHLAATNHRQGEIQQGRSRLERALEIDPDFPEAGAARALLQEMAQSQR